MISHFDISKPKVEPSGPERRDPATDRVGVVARFLETAIGPYHTIC
jgi:hypothetical protein